MKTAIDELSAEDLAHLLALKREEERRTAAARAEARARVLDQSDRPALGAFPRREKEGPSVEEWLRAEPSRLVGVVREMRRFSSDEARVVAAVLALADSAGIEEGLTDRIVGGAITSCRRGPDVVG